MFGLLAKQLPNLTLFPVIATVTNGLNPPIFNFH